MSESEQGKPRAAAPRITDEEKVMTITNQTDMSQTQAEDRMSAEEWLAIRKEAALKIDPENAEVSRDYVNLCDPYGVDPDPPESCCGKVHFARSPESDVWVCFDDLPNATCDRLYERMKKGEFDNVTLPRARIIKLERDNANLRRALAATNDRLRAVACLTETIARTVSPYAPSKENGHSRSTGDASVQSPRFSLKHLQHRAFFGHQVTPMGRGWRKPAINPMNQDQAVVPRVPNASSRYSVTSLG